MPPRVDHLTLQVTTHGAQNIASIVRVPHSNFHFSPTNLTALGKRNTLMIRQFRTRLDLVDNQLE